MDRFEFRVWDTKQKCFLEFIPPAEYMLDSDSWSHHDTGGDEASLTYPATICKHNFKGRLVWQQNTGIKDRDGKPIFEGDILVYNGIRGVVRFFCRHVSVGVFRPN